MDFDLNGTGGPDASYVPVYDGHRQSGRASWMRPANRSRYEFSAYGRRKIFVDSAPPAINQIRKAGEHLPDRDVGRGFARTGLGLSRPVKSDFVTHHLKVADPAQCRNE